MRTHYQSLRVAEDAEPEIIRAAYKALAQKWHPDRHPEQPDKAEQQFKTITAAYEILSTPQARAAYDAQLAEQRRTRHAQVPHNSITGTASQPARSLARPLVITILLSLLALMYILSSPELMNSLRTLIGQSPVVVQPPVSDSHSLTAPRGCEFKTVMTNQDYEACGLTPP